MVIISKEWQVLYLSFFLSMDWWKTICSLTVIDLSESQLAYSKGNI